MTIEDLREWLLKVPNQKAEVYFSGYSSHLEPFDPMEHTRFIEHNPNPHQLDKTDKLVIDFSPGDIGSGLE